MTPLGTRFQEHAMAIANRTFDRETLTMLKTVFEEASRFLPPHQSSQEARANLASKILRRAVEGGLSPAQLREYAIAQAASPLELSATVRAPVNGSSNEVHHRHRAFYISRRNARLMGAR
jgi:hypothetical protein